MKLPPLVPALIIITTFLLIPLLKSVGQNARELNSTTSIYGYSKGIKLFAWFGVLFFILIPTSFILSGVRPTRIILISSFIIIIFELFVAMYANIYCVILTKQSISIKSFFSKTVEFDSINKIILYSGLKVNWIEIWSSGDRLIIKNGISGYCDLRRTILDRIGTNVPIFCKDRYGNMRPYVE